MFSCIFKFCPYNRKNVRVAEFTSIFQTCAEDWRTNYRRSKPCGGSGNTLHAPGNRLGIECTPGQPAHTDEVVSRLDLATATPTFIFCGKRSAFKPRRYLRAGTLRVPQQDQSSKISSVQHILINHPSPLWHTKLQTVRSRPYRCRLHSI